jgi:UMF1 family MFS transporter
LEAREAVGVNPVRVGFSRVFETLRELRQHKQVFIFLLAFWFYNDCVGSIIKLGAIYGAEIGIPRETIFLTFLVVQFVGIPFTFAYGWLAGKIGAKRGLMLALGVYFGVCIYAPTIDSPTRFMILGVMVATSQGGAQALSRSIFASIVPKTKSSEFFGFFSVSAKFAGIFGPLIFAIVSMSMGSSRPGILSLIALIVVGMILLSRVDVEEGRRAAAEEDAEMLVVES